MPDRPPGNRAISLTWRLVAGYTLAALVTLSVAAFLLHRELRRGYEVEDHELLSDTIRKVQKFIDEDSGALTRTEDFIVHMIGDRMLEKYYGRLLDAKGALLFETPGLAQLGVPPELFPSPAPVNEHLPEVIYGKSTSGPPVFMLAGKVARGKTGEILTCQVVLDTSHVEEWLASYRDKLLLVVGGASAATALLGWFIAKRALRPLQEITATAQRITASGLDEHVGGKAWPEELALLAVEFDRMLARLRESFDRLSQFTADAAHEFRTPLNNLLGGTSLALARPRTADEYRALLEANVEEYQRLTHMMDSLLFLARSDNAQTVVKKQRIEAGDAMAEVIDFFSALAEESGITLTCTCGGSVTADPTLLRMALTNLVSNALRHAPRGSAVKLAAEERGGAMTFSVRDEGPGIAPEHLPRVFDRFYRVEESRSNSTDSRGGSGLGLALVKTIMTLHGGGASVESTAEGGTTFLLHFPSGGS
ncbi:MAG TPA: heavy metal sensor histidine kinase [Verrucomicrobiales bacterium]|jgi:two-component system heavy metal sensor histidine kinase CusS|nr:heavy metal sensor histidine kinase [Verrucomicrobiales bacterium]